MSGTPSTSRLPRCTTQNRTPQKGGLLYARYGKGTYVYMAYAFFRQMPDGVPGSFRIMANLISAGKNPGLAPSTAKH